MQRLELLTPGPLRAGSRARQVRVDQGRRTDCTLGITTLDRPSRVRFAETGNQFRIGYLMAPGAGGPKEAPTRLIFGFQLNRLELDMRPFERLIRAALQAGAERVARNLKRLDESEHTPSSQRPPGPLDRAS